MTDMRGGMIETGVGGVGTVKEYDDTSFPR